MTSLFYANVTALTDKVWKFVQTNSKRYQFWSLVETHVHDELELRAWDKSARAARLRLIHNPARRAGRATTEEGEIRSNEGGELFMSQFHLQAHRLYETTVASQHLSEPDQTSLDGFVATVVHMTGYSIIIVTLYGLPSLGMRGANRRRCQKIRGPPGRGSAAVDPHRRLQHDACTSVRVAVRAEARRHRSHCRRRCRHLCAEKKRRYPARLSCVLTHGRLFHTQCVYCAGCAVETSCGTQG